MLQIFSLQKIFFYKNESTNSNDKKNLKFEYDK